MELDVSKAFLSQATAFPFREDVSLAPQNVNGESVTFDPVALSGTFCLADDAVYLEGKLQTVAHGACALCMERADIPIEVDFSETFRKDANEAEDESFHYAGKSVPLDHMTLALVMLNIPMRFECKAGCEGSMELKAWKNENSGSSGEDGTSARRPFEALRSLLEEETGKSIPASKRNSSDDE